MLKDDLKSSFLKLVGAINNALARGDQQVSFFGKETKLEVKSADPSELPLTATVLSHGQEAKIFGSWGDVTINGISLPFIRYSEDGKDKVQVVLKRRTPLRWESPAVCKDSGEVDSLSIECAVAGLLGECHAKNPALKNTYSVLLKVKSLWGADLAGSVWGLNEPMSHNPEVADATLRCLEKCKELPRTPGAARRAGVCFKTFLSAAKWNRVRHLLKVLGTY